MGVSEDPGTPPLSMIWRTPTVRRDLCRQEDPGVHLPHRLLRLHCHCAMGRSHHLQDKEELRLPAGNEEHVHELWSLFRDSPGCLPSPSLSSSSSTMSAGSTSSAATAPAPGWRGRPTTKHLVRVLTSAGDDSTFSPILYQKDELIYCY